MYFCDDEETCEKCGFKVMLSNAWQNEERCCKFASPRTRSFISHVYTLSGMFKYDNQSQAISVSEMDQYSVSPRKADVTLSMVIL